MLIKDTPILILAFNRDEKFNSCLENIYKYGFRKIYVSIDGPRNKYDKKKQKIINKICQDYSELISCDLKTNFNDINFGCRKAVISGISWFFNNVNYGLIVEDDVLLTSNVSNVMCELLQKYRFDENIMTISSFNEFILQDVNSITLSPIFRSWGWATWAHKWREHLKFSNNVKNLSIRSLAKNLPKKLRHINNVRHVRACQLGLLDTWDYEFNFTHLALSKYSLTITGQNTLNIGFDSEATHTFFNENQDNMNKNFKNKQIDIDRQIKLSELIRKKIMKTSGFHEVKLNLFLNTIILFIESYRISVLFYLRLLKRKIFIK